MAVNRVTLCRAKNIARGHTVTRSVNWCLLGGRASLFTSPNLTCPTRRSGRLQNETGGTSHRICSVVVRQREQSLVRQCREPEAMTINIDSSRARMASFCISFLLSFPGLFIGYLGITDMAPSSPQGFA